MHTHSGKINQTFTRFDGFIFDIEGVIIRGEHVLPSAIETVRLLKSSRRLIFLSNISDLSSEDVAVKLQRLGFDVETDEIMTSGFATILFLKEHYPDKKKCYLIGTKSFENELIAHGYHITDGSGETADFAIIGLNYELNYQNKIELVFHPNNNSEWP